MEASKSQPAKAGTKPEPFETVCRICHKKVKTEAIFKSSVFAARFHVFVVAFRAAVVMNCHSCTLVLTARVSSGLINAKTLHKYIIEKHDFKNME